MVHGGEERREVEAAEVEEEAGEGEGGVRGEEVQGG